MEPIVKVGFFNFLKHVCMKKFIHAPLISLFTILGVVTLPFAAYGGGVQSAVPLVESPVTSVTTTASVVMPATIPPAPVKVVWKAFDISELGMLLTLPWTKDQVVTGCTQKSFDLADYTPCTGENNAVYYTLFKADDEIWAPRLQAVVVPTSLDLNITPLKTIKSKNFEKILFKPDQALIDQLNIQYAIKNELVDVPEYAIAVKQSSRTIILLFSMSDIAQSREFLLSSITIK